MKLAIGIIHGIGSQQPGFSIPMQRGIASAYETLNLSTHWNDLIFQEIIWADILKQQQQQLYERVNYKQDLDYQQIREFFIDYLGDAIAYQPLSQNVDADQIQVYHLIHQRIDQALQQFVAHPDLDAETPLILIGHSLGTVILSNFIWDKQHQTSSNSPLEECQTLVGLLTLGCPLALWSLRFKSFGVPIDFPGTRLSPSLSSKARWYNCYDKDDVIAYPLKNINPAYNEAVTDDIQVNVGSIFSSWNPLSHHGYWEDKDVIRNVAKFCASLQATDSQHGFSIDA